MYENCYFLGDELTIVVNQLEREVSNYPDEGREN